MNDKKVSAWKDTHHSVPTMRMPGIASFRKYTQLPMSSTAAGWKPAHVPFLRCVGDRYVRRRIRKKHNQYVMEIARGAPRSPREV